MDLFSFGVGEITAWLMISFGAGWMIGILCERLWGKNGYS